MKTFLLLAIGVLMIASCEKKSPVTIESRVDSLFRFWNRKDSPGAAVAVMQNGKIVFSKGYGMANLEYDVPIIPQSVFHIASESKQYTAFCLVLLQQEGKLKLDDDIRKHLPWVPDFGKKITIRHLIHHTSGLRDQWQLFAIAGQELDDVIRQSEVVKLVEMQKELNFEPGSHHMYCNTGYSLMAEIVKSVTGQTLRAYADEKIFKPLGMNNTHFHDDNTEIIVNRTYSYDSIKGKIVHSPLNYATVGATSLFTTVEDETKWLNNYVTGMVGGREVIDQMYEQGTLNNGGKLRYAFAINIDSLMGYRRIGHGGADAGYRTYAMRIPEEDFGVVVFSNFAGFNPVGLAQKVTALYLPDKSKKKDKPLAGGFDKSKYKDYVGTYRKRDDHTEFIIDKEQLTVKYEDEKYPLDQISDSTFASANGREKITFIRDKNTGRVTGFMSATAYEEQLYERYLPVSFRDINPASYTGKYVSDELDATYYVEVKNGGLVLRHRRYDDGMMTPITQDQFTTGHWWMWNINFVRDAKGNVSGFTVDSGRILGLKFRKV